MYVIFDRDLLNSSVLDGLVYVDAYYYEGRDGVEITANSWEDDDWPCVLLHSINSETLCYLTLLGIVKHVECNWCSNEVITKLIEVEKQ